MADKTKTYRTKTGKVLTDSDVETLGRRGRRRLRRRSTQGRRGAANPSMGSAAAEVVPVRLDPELKEAVESRAQREQTTTSEIIREALRKFLDVA